MKAITMNHMTESLKIMALVMVTCLLVSVDAYADSGAAVVQMVRNVQGYAWQMVTPLGTLAIIVLGIAAMFGRITWTQALVVAVGIAIASGAPSIYNDIAR